MTTILRYLLLIVTAICFIALTQDWWQHHGELLHPGLSMLFGSVLF